MQAMELMHAGITAMVQKKNSQPSVFGIIVQRYHRRHTLMRVYFLFSTWGAMSSGGTP